MPNPSSLPVYPIPLQGRPAPGYGALDIRRFLGVALQEGVVGATDFKIVQRAGGAGLGVDVTAGEAVVQGDSISRQGLYYAVLESNLTGGTEVTASAGDATNPRIDQVVLEIKDNAHDGSGLNTARVRIITGTPTAGATLDNRLGAAALPASCLRLADFLMPAAGATVTTANIRDRRPWARGANLKKSDTAGNFSLGGLGSVGGTTRVECSGTELRVEAAGSFEVVTADVALIVALQMDGVTQAPNERRFRGHIASGQFYGFSAVWTLTPSAASHVFQFQAGESAADIVLSRSSAQPLTLKFQETVRQDAENV